MILFVNKFLVFDYLSSNRIPFLLSCLPPLPKPTVQKIQLQLRDFLLKKLEKMMKKKKLEMRTIMEITKVKARTKTG